MTLALTLMVIVLVTFVALRLHGWHFFSYFMPAGVPVALAPLLVPIEILSYLSRIISLSVRLFANMMAGHVMLEVFGAFVVMLGGAGLLGIVPAAMVVLGQRGPDRLRAAGGNAAGLRLRRADLHLPARRRSPPLIPRSSQRPRGCPARRLGHNERTAQMDLAAAKDLGAGLAVIALAGVGVGIGNIFAALVNSVARNPASRDRVFGLAILGFALTEAVALYALVIAFIILFV